MGRSNLISIFGALLALTLCACGGGSLGGGGGSVPPGGEPGELDSQWPDLVTALNLPHQAPTSIFTLRDSQGRSMDGLKIVQAGPSEFLGVYHTNEGSDRFCLRAAQSSDLSHWSHTADIDCDFASQGTITKLSDGRILLAYEKNPGRIQPFIRFQLFQSADAYKGNQLERSYDVPRNPYARAEGTPNFRKIVYNGNPSQIQVEIGFHYNDPYYDRDLNAIGVMTGFAAWSFLPNNSLNYLLAQRAAHHLGDRDFIVYKRRPFTLVEAMTTRNDWSSWRIYLYDELANHLTQLNYQVPDGSLSMGNPTLGFAVINGSMNLIGTAFIFTPSTLPGCHLFRRVLGPTSRDVAPSVSTGWL